MLGLSHGGALQQKDYSVLAEHLASHGYIVAAPRHSGNSGPDTLTYALTGGLTCGALPVRPCHDSGNVPALNSPQDVSFALDKVFDGTLGSDLKAAADKHRVGVFGHSFGGYTSLMLAGGLESDEGSLMAGDLADPRIGAMAALSGVYGDLPASSVAPAIKLPKQNAEAIHIPSMIMYGEYETNVRGIDLAARAREIFDHLNPEKTGIQYRIVAKGAVHSAFGNLCDQGNLDIVRLGNDNPTGIDVGILALLFTSDSRVPPSPPTLTGKTDGGFQAYCQNRFFYGTSTSVQGVPGTFPSNRNIWDALTLPLPAPPGITLGSLLLNNPPFSIPLNNLPGFIDPDTFQFVPTKSSDEIQNLTNGYLVSFFNSTLKGQSQYQRFIKGNGKAEVGVCTQADGHRKCKMR